MSSELFVMMMTLRGCLINICEQFSFVCPALFHLFVFLGEEHEREDVSVQLQHGLHTSR